MNNEDKILKKLENHDEKFKDHDEKFDKIDKRFDEVDKRFDEVGKRFDKVEDTLDLLATKVLEHDDRLERIENTMATKEDINKLSGTLDYIVGKLDKNEQENVFGGNRVSRVEKKVEVHDEEIGNIKVKLSALPA